MSLPRLRTMLATIHGARAMHAAEGAELSADGEKLPVVEPKPFTKKEWRPANSLPMYERSATVLSNPLPANKRSPFYETWSYIELNKTPAQVTPRDGPRATEPRAYSVPGDKTTSHPKTRDKVNLQHAQQGLVQPFVPKMERERSTMTNHAAQARPVTDNGRHQMFTVQGRKIANPPRTSALYYSPWEYYSLTRSLHSMSRNDSQSKSETRADDGREMYIDGGDPSPLDDLIYDTFDRSNTLPSIRVHKAALGKRVAPGPENGAVRKPSVMHQLGVANSLDLMAQCGQLSGVEHNLNERLRLTMNHLRRSKPSPLAGALRTFKNIEFAPTSGEQSLRSGRKANGGSYSRRDNGSSRAEQCWLGRPAPSLERVDTSGGVVVALPVSESKRPNRSAVKFKVETTPAQRSAPHYPTRHHEHVEQTLTENIPQLSPLNTVNTPEIEHEPDQVAVGAESEVASRGQQDEVHETEEADETSVTAPHMDDDQMTDNNHTESLTAPPFEIQPRPAEETTDILPTEALEVDLPVGQDADFSDHSSVSYTEEMEQVIIPDIDPDTPAQVAF